MQFNLFMWIREGVKRSVMAGVADAIEHVGAPPSSQDLHNSLQNFIQHIESPLEPAAALAGGGGGAEPAQGRRKRLGRSLRDFEGKQS